MFYFSRSKITIVFCLQGGWGKNQEGLFHDPFWGTAQRKRPAFALRIEETCLHESPLFASQRGAGGEFLGYRGLSLTAFSIALSEGGLRSA